MRDTVDPDFASYVDARQGRWLRTAYLVYGDLERAEEALLRAFTRLSGLSPAQRTVFVLLHLEELTEFEVADVLSLSHQTVHGHGMTAFSRFRTALGAGDWRDAGTGDSR